MPASRHAPASGFAGAEALAAEARARLERRLADGSITEIELERVSALVARTFAGRGAASEAFRRCCIAWEVDRDREIRSHRPVVGAAIVAVKRLVARALRFQTQDALAQQREFNRNLLVVLADLVERVERDRPSRPPG